MQSEWKARKRFFTLRDIESPLLSQNDIPFSLTSHQKSECRKSSRPACVSYWSPTVQKSTKRTGTSKTKPPKTDERARKDPQPPRDAGGSDPPPPTPKNPKPRASHRPHHRPPRRADHQPHPAHACTYEIAAASLEAQRSTAPTHQPCTTCPRTRTEAACLYRKQTATATQSQWYPTNQQRTSDTSATHQATEPGPSRTPRAPEVRSPVHRVLLPRAVRSLSTSVLKWKPGPKPRSLAASQGCKYLVFRPNRTNQANKPLETKVSHGRRCWCIYEDHKHRQSVLDTRFKYLLRQPLTNPLQRTRQKLPVGEHLLLFFGDFLNINVGELPTVPLAPTIPWPRWWGSQTFPARTGKSI